MTTTQKVLVGLCVAGVAALAYDRVSSDGLPGPQQAAASPMPVQPPAAPVSKPVVNKASNVPEVSIQTNKALAERLTALTGGKFPQLDDIHDAFYASGLEPKVVQTPAAPTVHTEPVVQCKPRKEVFAQSHTLRAVLVSSGGRMALMDNTCLKIGQKVEEFTLTDVGERTASFKASSGEKVTFSLPQKPDAQ